MTEPQDVLADILHGTREAATYIIKQLAEEGYALVRTPETLDVEPVPGAPACGAPAVGGPCVLARGHNMGRVDIPEYHAAAASPTPSEGLRPSTWWRDDCACRVLDVNGDGCHLTANTNEPTHLCLHCQAHAAVAPFAYPGSHDDCIATVQHFHDRPYRVGDWGGAPDPSGLRETLRIAADCLEQALGALVITQPQIYLDDWKGGLRQARAARAATPAPREDGWDELRREIEALHDDPIRFGSAKDASQNTARAVLAIVDRLAAARGEPPMKRKNTDWSNVVVDEGDEAP